MRWQVVGAEIENKQLLGNIIYGIIVLEINKNNIRKESIAEAYSKEYQKSFACS